MLNIPHHVCLEKLEEARVCMEKVMEGVEPISDLFAMQDWLNWYRSQLTVNVYKETAK